MGFMNETATRVMWTGRARVRVGWRGLLILQMERSRVMISACPPPPGHDALEWLEKQIDKGRVECWWADARLEDIQDMANAGTVLRFAQMSGERPSCP